MAHGRALLTPGYWRGNLPASSATLNAQLWVDAAPWRLTAGWVFIAGLLAGGALQQWQAIDIKDLLLLWLLVDLLWGALWRLAGGRAAILGLGAAAGDGTLRLPYMQGNSPAAQLLSLDERNSLPYLVRVALPTLLVALVVAAVLGVPALISTGALVIVTVGGWILRRTLQTPPLLLHAVAMVALPWLLTLLQVGATPDSTVWPAAVALGVLWTLHTWGEARSAVWQQERSTDRQQDWQPAYTEQAGQVDRLALWLMGAMQVGLLLLLVVNKTPLWAPIVAILLLPTWLRTLRKLPLVGLSGWWMAAFLVSALALGWR
jgi:hypothetical protein